MIVCVDTEAVRDPRTTPQVFSRKRKFAYCVTTQPKFEETLGRLFGAGNDGGSIDPLLADMDSTLENEAHDDSSLESAAADNELVKFVNKVIIDAHNLKVSAVLIKPMSGKAKTGILLKIYVTPLLHIAVQALF